MPLHQKIGIVFAILATLWLVVIHRFDLVPPNWNNGIGLGLVVLALAFFSGGRIFGNLLK